MYLSPSYLRRQVDLDRLQALLTKYEQTDKTFFVKNIKEAIDDIEQLMAMD